MMKNACSHRITIVLLAMLSVVLYVSGQERPIEYQARLVTHLQSVETNNHIGFAGWVILPNVLKTSPLRALLLSGVLIQNRERWIELMCGGIVAAQRITEPVVSSRFLEKSVTWIELYNELEYNFTAKRFYANGIVTTPIAGSAVRIGVESDLFMSQNVILTNIGPRVTFRLPFEQSMWKNILLITAFKIQSDNSKIIRLYLVVNF